MSTLPEGFTFSQSSLQDYKDCQRRFELRYLLQLAWPAIESEPARENERLMQQGARFHQLVHKYILGLSTQQLSNQIHDPDLRRWWDNFLASFNSTPGLVKNPVELYPEVSLTASLADFRIVAKCDLIAIDRDSRLIIFDWKTSQKPPQREWLRQRLQTRLYPYILVQSGAYLFNGEPVMPNQVEMVYWYAEDPDSPVRFPYTEQQNQSDGVFLSGLIKQIQQHQLGEFHRTQHEERCRYCIYRSLCDRGVTAGPVTESDSDYSQAESFEIQIDLERVRDIEY
jgi:hypothetical protein